MSQVPALGPWAVAFLVNLWTVGGVLALGCLAALGRARGLHPRARYGVVLATFVLAAVAPAVLASGIVPARGPVAGALTSAGGGPSALVFPVAPLVVVVWVLVASVLVLREVGGHLGLALRARRSSRVDPVAVGLDGWPEGVRLLLGEGGSPMAWGVVRPVVYLPRRLPSRLSRRSLAAVAAHELDHLRWHDPGVLAVLRLVNTLLWPSLPLRLLARAAMEEREAAADRTAAESLGGGEEVRRLSWAETLVSLARGAGRNPPLATGLPGPRLARRVRRLTEAPPKPGGAGWVAGIGLLALIAVTWVPVSAGAHSYDPARAGREGWTAVDRLLGENPTVVLVDERRLVNRRVVTRPEESATNIDERAGP